MSLKSFGKNTVIYAIGNISLRLTSFLLIPIYTHYLTKTEFGLLQTILLTIQILIPITDLGMRTAVVRFFSDYEKKEKLKYLLGTSTLVNVLIGIFIIFLSQLIPDELISNFFETKLIPGLILFTVITAVLQTLNINLIAYFRARNQSIIFSVISITTSIFLIIISYLFLVVYSYGIIGVLWAQSITFGLASLLIIIWLYYKHRLAISQKVLNLVIKFGAPLVLVMTGDLLVQTIGNYLLGYFNTLEQVAVISLAIKIASIIKIVLIGPFQLAYEPYAFRNKDNKNFKENISKTITYVVSAYMLISFCLLIIFRDLIILVGNSEYNESYHLIFFILPAMGSMLFNYLGQALLFIKNKSKKTGYITLFSAIISIILLYFLIKYSGMYGFILGTNFYFFLSSFWVYYLGVKEIHVKLDYKRISVLLFIIVLHNLLVYFLSSLNNLIFYSASIFILIITIIYLAKSNFLTNNEKKLFKDFIQKYLKSKS